MPVGLGQFSAVAAKADARPTDAVSVTSRDNVKLGGSRFRLVRWVNNLNVGNRLRNRKTVSAFIASLRQQFGADVVEKMDLGSLRNMKRWGKPLQVRHVNAGIEQASRQFLLSGYGLRGGNSSEKLQQVIDRLPQAQQLSSQYGLKLDAANLPPAWSDKLSLALNGEMEKLLAHPESFPTEEMPAARMEQQLNRSAEQILSGFVQERLDALAALQEQTPEQAENIIRDRIAQKIDGAAYQAAPGGQALARSILATVDYSLAREDYSYEMSQLRSRIKDNPELLLAALNNACDWSADQAIGAAQKELLLSGYGLRAGNSSEKLQQVIDRLPQAQQLSDQYGLKLDAANLPPAWSDKLSRKLDGEIKALLAHPESSPAEEPLAARVEQQLSRSAEQILSRFMQERLDALAALRELLTPTGARDAPAETSRRAPNDDDLAGARAGMQAAVHGFGTLVGSFASPAVREQLCAAVLHSNIPASQLPRLCALRAETPDNLGDLASPDHTMEHKFRTLRQFGATLNRTVSEMSLDEHSQYVLGPDDSLDYLSDCARFLLAGKLSDTDEAALRQALGGAAGSDLLTLRQSLASMETRAIDESLASGDGNPVTDPIWGEAYTAAKQSTHAINNLPGGSVDAPADLDQGYTLPVCEAMRSCGIGAPAPGDIHTRQAGAGRFNVEAMRSIEAALRKEVGALPEASGYPGFTEEALRDFNRATYTIGGIEAARDKDDVVARLRELCAGADGAADEQLLRTVSDLVYQRTQAVLMLNTMTEGDTRNLATAREGDVHRLIRVAPFTGIPTYVQDYGDDSTPNRSEVSYQVEKTASGNIMVNCTNSQPVRFMQAGGQHQFLDTEQSSHRMSLTLEVNAGDYSVNVDDASYEFSFVPLDDESA